MQTRVLTSVIPFQHTYFALFTTCAHAACRCMGTINYSHSVWLWLMEFNGVTPTCRFTLFRSTIFFPSGCMSHITGRLVQPIAEGSNSLLSVMGQEICEQACGFAQFEGTLSLSCGCMGKQRDCSPFPVDAQESDGTGAARLCTSLALACRSWVRHRPRGPRS